MFGTTRCPGGPPQGCVRGPPIVFAKAHVAKVRSNIEAKMDEQDAKAAALDADLAEGYALDAISFAQGAIEEAEAASLDAVYARANAVALSS